MKATKLPKFWLILILAIVAVIALLNLVYATPIGPAVTVFGNSTKNATLATKVNSTINGTISPGSYIFTMSVTSQQQNTRWKGYVGNVTGTLVLDDANDNTLFSWTLGSSLTGEIYATRASGNVNWTGINCTWIAAAADMKFNNSNASIVSNRTPEVLENRALSHTNLYDNITATFVNTNHTALTIGTVVIGQNECFSVHTYFKDAAQSFDTLSTANFTEVILYDGAFNSTNGNVVYEAKIEQDKTGYKADSTYDFQMILPESGAVGFTSSTAYYFYVELT